jgi:hypothetical protein
MIMTTYPTIAGFRNKANSSSGVPVARCTSFHQSISKDGGPAFKQIIIKCESINETFMYALAMNLMGLLSSVLQSRLPPEVNRILYVRNLPFSITGKTTCFVVVGLFCLH